MQTSLDRYQAAFGPIPGWVIEMAKNPAMWSEAASMLDEAWFEDSIDDWQAFEGEVLRRYRQFNTGRPRLRNKPSAFDQHVIDYGPQVLHRD